MKRVLELLLVSLTVLFAISAAGATSITLNATARDDYYTPQWGGWNGPYTYLNDNANQYIVFNTSGIANNANVIIDSAYVTIAPDAANWNGVWGSEVGLYRATSFNIAGGVQGTYDRSVMYSQAATSATAAMVFDATSLVRGWTLGAWGSVVGGVTLSYVVPSGNSNLMWTTSDLSGATLTVNYHTAQSVTVNATARDDFYTPGWSGWNGPNTYLDNTDNQYIQFNVSAIANNPNVSVDSAYVMIAPDATNWNSNWGTVTGLYRATSFDLVHGYPGSFDNSSMYSQATTSATEPMIFDATSLVRGWAAGYWSGDDIGGVTLSYVDSTGNNSTLMWPTSDLSGASLIVQYHTVSGSSVALDCTGRNSVYLPYFTGWNSYAYLSDTQIQYIQFNIGSLANNPNIAVDAANVTILNGSHVGNWNGVWNSVAGLYRAPVVGIFSTVPEYDDSVVYGQAGMHQTANSVFDATSLVQGWAANEWPGDDVGGVAITYINPSGNANLMYSTSDLAGAVLNVDYHSTATGPITATPTFSPNGGTFTSPYANVVISCATAGATIYYTTDGSTPSQSNGTAITSGTAVVIPNLSTPYNGAVTLSAVAVASGYAASNVAIAAYTVPALNRPQTIQYANNVTVDGNLSDWADAQWAPIDQYYDTPNEVSSDYPALNADIPEAYYAAKWGGNGNVVYVAVKVRDKGHFFTNSWTSWNASDHVEVYLHTTGSGHSYGANEDDAQQYVFGLNTPHTAVWTDLGNGNAVPTSAGFHAASSLGSDGWVYYECAMTPFQYYGGLVSKPSITSPLAAGQTIGLDVIVLGTDSTGSYVGMKSENLMGSKYGVYTNFGQHLLVQAAGLSNAKNAPENSSVTTSGIVTAVFGDCFYIESADRTSGIEINQANSGLSAGQLVDVFGTVQTLATGERCVTPTYCNPSGTANVIEPLGMTNKALGGGTSGLQSGVSGGSGLNNIGLLVRTTGLASAGSASGFVLTDGSGVTLNVSFPGAGTTYNAKYVTVTGISSIDSNGNRVVKAVSVQAVD